MSIDYQPSPPLLPRRSRPGRRKILTALRSGPGLLRAARSGVTRALDTVEEHLDEQAVGRPATAKAPAAARRAYPGGSQLHAGRRDRRVRDVMTTSVVTLDRITPYKEIARLLTEHPNSGLAVPMMGRQAAGVVTGAGPLAVWDKAARRARMATAGHRRPGTRRQRNPGLTARELMEVPDAEAVCR